MHGRKAAEPAGNKQPVQLGGQRTPSLAFGKVPCIDLPTNAQTPGPLGCTPAASAPEPCRPSPPPCCPAGGFLQLRTGLKSAGKSAVFGGVLLAMIEGVGILLTRVTAPPPAPGAAGWAHDSACCAQHV